MLVALIVGSWLAASPLEAEIRAVAALPGEPRIVSAAGVTRDETPILTLENPDALASVRENSNILTLKDRKAKLEAEYQDNLKVYKPAFPKMQQLQGQIAELDKQLQAEYQDVRRTALATYRTARTQETMLKDRLTGAKQHVLDLQGRSIRHGILKREVDTNRTLYDGLSGA